MNFSADGASHSTAMQYCDELGRPTLTATDGMGGKGKYVYTMQEYDDKGRNSRQWLPAVGDGSVRNISDYEFSSLSSSTYNNDGYAYSDNEYDALDRPTFTQTPGSAWHNAGKGVRKEYVTNDTLDVRLYESPMDGKNHLVKSGFYRPHTLIGERTIDEDGHMLNTYTDKLGRKVLERRMSDTGNNDTYFVYNDQGQLRFVLSPEYQNNGKKAIFGYEYRYDEKGNIVKKFLPQCEYIQYWYDNDNRLIYMQDGRMREKGLYRFYLYDKLSRVVAEGTCTSCNRGITNIEYDLRNNPRLIQFSDGSQTEYVYSALGEKMKTIHRTATPNSVVCDGDDTFVGGDPASNPFPMPRLLPSSSVQNTDTASSQDMTAKVELSIDSTEYIGNFIFENGHADKYLFPGGYYTYASTNTPPSEGTGEVSSFHYYLTDHLGNNRVVVNDNGDIEQTTHYYPYGAVYADAGKNPDFQKFKYTGKELDLTHGLNTYDHGARQNYSILSVWDRIDPLAEEDYNISPYTLCRNNPLLFIDLSGKKDTAFVEGKDKPIKGEPNTETFIYIYDVDGKPIGFSPNKGKAYNCHSYAWENSEGDPTDKRNEELVKIGITKWDNYPDNNMNDYYQLDNNTPNIPGDRVIYYNDLNENGKYDVGENVEHSAIVNSVDKDGYTTTVKSKMGEGPISINHPLAPGFYDKSCFGPTKRAYFRHQ